MFADPVTIAEPWLTDEHVPVFMSSAWSVRQGGGIACEWSNGAPVGSEGRFDYQGARIKLVPADRSLWQAFSDASAGGADRVSECMAFELSFASFCSLNSYLLDSWWLLVEVEGIAADPAGPVADMQTLADPLFAAVESAVSALGPPSTPWSLPAPVDDVPVPTTCESLIDSDELAAVYGIPSMSAYEQLAAATQQFAAAAQVGGGECRWAGDGSGSAYGTLHWLPGGEWAFRDQVAAREHSAPVESVAFGYVAAADTAWGVAVDFDSLDFVAYGTWFKIVLQRGGADDAVTKADAVAIAERILTNLAS